MLSTILPTLLLLLAAAGRARAIPALPRRATQSIDGTLLCGIFATGAKATAAGLLTDLDAGARGRIAARTFLVHAGACERVHCWDSTGISVCNGRADGRALVLRGDDVWQAANHVYKGCCNAVTDAFYGQGGATSGQKFVRGPDGANWNAVIAYANCRSPTNKRPADAGGWGVNGQCKWGITDVYSS